MGLDFNFGFKYQMLLIDGFTHLNMNALQAVFALDIGLVFIVL